MLNSTIPGQLFILDDAYTFGHNRAVGLEGRILGRLAGSPHDYGLLAQAVFNAGGGNHADIGTLYGASAIIAAWTKEEFLLGGQVYAIDPLDGYYGAGNPDYDCKDIPVSQETLMKNLNLCKVQHRVEIIPASSNPWPIQVSLASAYVDGDHTYVGARTDIHSVLAAGAELVVCDNYDARHQGVIGAVSYFMNIGACTLIHVSGVTAVLERNLDG